MLVDDVIKRLQAEVPAFVAVEAAAELAAVLKGGGAPNRTPAAFVVSAGLRVREADAVTGLYRQSIVESTIVLLVAGRAGDGRGGAASGRVEPLRDAIILALAGWSPPDAFGPIELSGARLVDFVAGTVFYEVSFDTPQQLRIER